MVRLDRINELSAEKKWSRRELERQAGVGVGSIAKWGKSNATEANLKKVADTLGVSVAYLTGDSDFRSEQDAVIDKWNKQMSPDLPEQVRKIEAGIRIPVIGEVPCGIPMEAIEDIDADDWEEISEKLARTGRFFALKAKGNSMSPRIEEGDTLIVKQTEDCESGDIVIVKVNGDDACCKKIIKEESGIMLQSFNPAYSPMFFSNAEIIAKPVKIIGKVVENRQKFN